ncbi:MAG: cysteine desulfurase, partial [Nitrososphaerota archaeon]
MLESSVMLDPRIIKNDFPILQRVIDGKRLIYLDNAATTQKPMQVINAIKQYYENFNANVHRGVYELSIESTEIYENARKTVANFIGAKNWREIIFTRNTTEGINLVAYAYGLHNLKDGDKIVLTEMEHHSNIVPWQIISSVKKAKILHLPVTNDGYLMTDILDKYLKDAKIFALTHASNVLGTINPVKELIKVAKEYGATTIIDGAQSVPHFPVNVSDIGADFYAFSGHKMLGPLGVGVLYANRKMLEEMNPFLGGGEMIKEVSLERSVWNEVPWKFEAGTPSVADAIGLAEAVKYLNKIGMDNVRKHELELTSYAYQSLVKLPKIRLLGPINKNDRTGLISFTLADIHPHDLAEFLDKKYGIAIRAGHHCAMPIHTKFGLIASARISFYIYNTIEEIDVLVNGLRDALRVF